jgi:hypothetical protein
MEGGHGDTLHKLYRTNVANQLSLLRILDHFEIEDVSEEEIDAALDQE